MKEYLNVFRNYANFSGFLKKKPYWTAVFIDALIKFLLILPGILCVTQVLPSLPRFYFTWVLPLGVFYSLLAWIPFWAAAVRRLHTLPKSGWTLLLGFIPVVGWILLLVFLCQEGQYEKIEGKFAALLPGFRQAMEKPRNGAWFFAALAVLVALGLVGNAKIRQLDLPELNALGAAVQTVEEEQAEDRNVTESIEEPDEAEPVETGEEPDQAEPVETVEEPEEAVPANTQEPTPVSTLPEQFTEEENGAYLNTQDFSELLPVDEKLYVSRTAVSVGQYRQCMNAGVCTEPADYAAYFENAESYPMVGVTSEQAAAYCGWAGMRLPTAEEWQLAAEGSFIGESVNYSAYLRNDIDALRLWETGIGTIPVDTADASVSSAGMLQMMGNTWEWVATESEEAPVRQAFGGAWNSVSLPLAQPLETLPSYAADNIGFRCAVALGNPVAPEPAAADDNAEEESTVAAEDPLGDSLSPEPAAADDSAADPLLRAADGMELVQIPESSFTMGLSAGAQNEKPAHEVSLSAYRIDKYEVSNAQYALCVEAGDCSVPHEVKSFRRASYYGDSAYANYPVVAVDWQQAADYCAWAGGRLPTEAEWEHAARGPENTLYPWGKQFDKTRLNYSGAGTNYDTVAVNETPEDLSGYGVVNLAGNVMEWVADAYQENWYAVTAQVQDPTGPETGYGYVIRGASAQTGENNARAVFRFYGIGTSYALDRGFRCVMDGAQ